MPRTKEPYDHLIRCQCSVAVKSQLSYARGLSGETESEFVRRAILARCDMVRKKELKRK